MIAVKLTGSEVRTLQNKTTGAELNVIASRGMVFSSWRPSPEEAVQLQSGKPVWVVIRGEIVPEFHLQVGDRNEVVPPEIIKRAQQADAILNTPLGEQVVAKKKRDGLLVEAIAWGYAALCIAAVVFLCYAGFLWIMAEPIGR